MATRKKVVEEKTVEKKVIEEKNEVKAYGLVTGTNFPRTRTKVAIVGFAPSTMEHVKPLFGNPEWEIWGLNQLYIALPPMEEFASRWFQLHHRHSYDINLGRAVGHHEWMAAQRNMVIYMQKQEPDVPMSVAFPKEEFVSLYGNYFTNSISWMIMTAVHEKFEEISIFGVDMAQDCITPETKVLTADLRYIPAGEIKVGDKVIGFDENPGTQTEGPHAYRQWRCATVGEANRLVRPSYRVHLSDGTKIVSSAGHQWLTYGEHMMKWKRTDELVTSTHRHPTQLVRVLDKWDEDRSWEAGYLAAAFDGEGSFSQLPNKHNNGTGIGLGFAQRENGMSDQVDAILDRFGFKYGRYENNGVLNYNINGGRADAFRFLGMIRPRRLMENFNPNMLGTMQRKETVAVEKIEFLGDQEVIGFKTSTKTFVAEGFASHNSEYKHERPSCEWAIGWARGAGIKVNIPEASDLFKTLWLYPFEDSAPFRAKVEARRVELRARHDTLANQEQMMHDQRMQLLGALDNQNYILQSWESSIREMPTQQEVKK